MSSVLDSMFGHSRTGSHIRSLWSNGLRKRTTRL